MPPSPRPAARQISSGVGPISGLQFWLAGDKILVVDRTPTGSFAQDMSLWNSALGLKESTLKQIKDAIKKQDTT